MIPTPGSECPTDKYLKNGHYYVEYLTPSGATGHTEMDFITVSRCILREGERVLLNVDSATYQEMQGLVPGLRVPDKAMHTLLMKGGTNEDMQGSGGTETVQLAAYYILGDTAETEELPLPDACLRLIVLVHSQELEHDAFQHDRDADVIVFTKLFNGTGMRVDVARDPKKPLVEHLVRQARPRETVVRVGLDADKRSIWQ